jgi:hypothetical protein
MAGHISGMTTCAATLGSRREPTELTGIQALIDSHFAIDKSPMEAFIGQVFLDIAGCSDVRFSECRTFNQGGALQFQGSLDKQVKAIASEFFERALSLECVKECLEKWEEDPEGYMMECNLIEISREIYNKAFIDIAFTNLAKEPAFSMDGAGDPETGELPPSITYLELFEVLEKHYAKQFPFIDDLMLEIYTLTETETD